MISKILKFGTGSGRSVVDYLLRDKDHAGRRRAAVEVLRGDPALVGRLIDSLKFKHRYSSIVLAWHRNDNPTRDQIEHVLDGFDITARSGLTAKRLGYFVVLHADDDGAKHVHIPVARVDLKTGKSFNLAPPGWQPAFDQFCDALNYRYGWARPNMPSVIPVLDDDSITERTIELSEKITRGMLKRILIGRISSRNQLLQALGRFGRVSWEGHRYLKIVPNGSAKAIALRGACFGKNFDFSSIPISMDGDISKFEVFQSIDLARSEAAIFNLEARILRRAQYNLTRYDGTQSPDELSAEIRHWQRSGPSPSEAFLANVLTDRPQRSGGGKFPPLEPSVDSFTSGFGFASKDDVPRF